MSFSPYQVKFFKGLGFTILYRTQTGLKFTHRRRQKVPIYFQFTQRKSVCCFILDKFNQAFVRFFILL